MFFFSAGVILAHLVTTCLFGSFLFIPSQAIGSIALMFLGFGGKPAIEQANLAMVVRYLSAMILWSAWLFRLETQIYKKAFNKLLKAFLLVPSCPFDLYNLCRLISVIDMNHKNLIIRIVIQVRF